MFTPTQIEIIKHFGSKELSEGCIVRDLYRDSQPIGKYLCDWKYLYEGNIWFIPDNEMTDGWEIENIFEILGHIPELFPDVARELSKNGYVLELLKVDTIKSVLKISRFDMKKDILIPYKKLIPLIDQEESTLVQLLNLFK